MLIANRNNNNVIVVFSIKYLYVIRNFPLDANLNVN